jgi:hypothetical protein
MQGLVHQLGKHSTRHLFPSHQTTIYTWLWDFRTCLTIQDKRAGNKQ